MAAKNFGRVNVSITASTGGLTAGLGRASKQLGGFAGQAQGIGGRLTGMAAGFVGAGRSATIAAVGVKALGLAIKSLLGPLLIVTSLVSIFAAFGRSARDLDDASKSASRLGLSMTTFQNLSMMAEEAGVEVGAFTNLLTNMTVNLGNLRNGSKSAQSAFASIGLTFADLQALSPEQQFDKISRAIMALPQGERLSAAYKIFGKSGAAAMGLIASAAEGTRAEIAQLQAALGVTFSDDQLKRGLPQGIEMMNDAMGRLGLLTEGFFNQLVGELAPAITTVANLIVKFFAQNSSGWSMATSLAYGLGQAIRVIAGAVTFLYGAFQVLSSFVGVFITGALTAFESVTWALGNMLSAMADAAEALPGFDMGIASGLRSASDSVSSLSTAAGDEAALWGQAAAENLASGVQNMSHPFAAFDAEFASVEQQMRQAGAAAGEAIGEAAKPSLAAAVKASTQALQAIVVGTGEGEAFRNSIMRGADPRNEGDAVKETADNTAEMVDQLDELNGALAGSGGFGLATIAA